MNAINMNAINMNAINKKVKEFKTFLNKKNIKYVKFDVSTTSILHMDNIVTIHYRSEYNNNIAKLKISPLLFEMIKKFISEVNLSHEIDKIGLNIEKQKLNNLLVKVDKTLKNNKLSINFENNKTFGGYTKSRKEIVLFDPKDETIEQYIKIVPGINYHELGHVLYTCSFKLLVKDIERKYSQFDNNFNSLIKKSKISIVNSILSIINVFEDGRIENLMGNKYGTSIVYFKQTFYNFLYASIKDQYNQVNEMSELECVLIAGRKYINKDIRKWVFEKYIECDKNHTKEKAKRINCYINKFITLSWRKNRDEMLDLVLGFFFEFIKPNIDKQKTSNWENLVNDMISISTEMNQMTNDDIDSENDEERLLKKILQDITNEIKSNSISKKCSKKEIKKKIEEEIEKNDNEIKNEIKKLNSKLKSTSADKKENLNFKEKLISTNMKKSKVKLEKKLKQFKEICRNGYLTKKKKGNVDIGESRRQEFRGGMRIFKQYKHNVQKALDIDVAFVLDCSYSMAGQNIINSAKQLWISSSACSSIGAKVKIFTFSDYFLGILDQSKKKNYYNIPTPMNGTSISDSLLMAENYLNCSKANIKWLIVLTDGEIMDEIIHEQIIEKIKKQNITCGKLNLNSSELQPYYNHTMNINNNTEDDSNNIVSFFEKIYKISMKKVC